MHLSFSAVNENADENKTFLGRKTKMKVTCAYITELSYGSVAKITFFGPTQMTFSERKRKIKQK